MDDEIDELTKALYQIMTPLIAKGARHDSAAHESEAAKKDSGISTFSYCSGCRLNVLTSILSDLHTFRDDVLPQKRLGGKSQREIHIEKAQRWLQAVSQE